MTSFGALPAQVLRKHDPLRLHDGSVARIAWTDKIHLDEEFLASYPDAQPILIRAGALGAGVPTQDLLLSPDQKVGVTSADYSQSFRMARDLLDRPGILRQPQTGLTYYLFHCGQPARVMVAGAQVLTTP